MFYNIYMNEQIYVKIQYKSIKTLIIGWNKQNLSKEYFKII